MTHEIDDQVLRQRIDRLLLSDVFRIRTAEQPQAHLKHVVGQLCWEAGIDVDIVRVEEGADRGEQVIVWRSRFGGPFETHSFTRGRRRSRRFRSKSPRQWPSPTSNAR
jgi:hypothetical protein